jgi:FemAB-related protein (PEP-CTERM system-associated)
MDLIECDDSMCAAWDEYVCRSSDASFYHRYGWRRINEEEFGHRSFYLAAVEDGRVSGVFPVVRVKSLLFGNLACSMPFVNFGGPCGDTAGVEEALLNQAEALVTRERLAYLEMRNRRLIGSGLPTCQHKVSMTVALDADPETLWKAFKHQHRQEIRRAAKFGLNARCGGAELLDDFYTVLSESWRDLGTPLYRRSYFRRIMEQFPGATRICLVCAGGEPAAAAFYGIHGKVAEGMWLGARLKFRRQLAGYLLYWEFIRDACILGLERFHLGRSSNDSGGEAHKRKWNAYPTPLYWQYVLGTQRALPALNVQNPRYQFAIRAWRRLPLAVTQRVGPALARTIP